MLVVSLWLPAATAEEPSELVAPLASEADPDSRWFPLVVPAVGYNSTDGLGFGLGVQAYSRPVGQSYGYHVKLTGGLWSTLGFGYQAHSLRVDVDDRVDWAGKLGYNRWDDMRYAGNGGGDVIVDWRDAEGGNFVSGPYAFLGAAVPVAGTAWAPYLQTYARTVRIEPGDGLLAARAPFGGHGGTYADVTAGVLLDTTDRWPLPTTGTQADASLATGGTWARGQPRRFGDGTMVQVHAEVIHWVPVGDERLVIGVRGVADRVFGHQPFFEQDVIGGRWRDELGSDQMLSGYGRTRTRGDGVLAGMIEVRPFLWRSRHPFWDLAVHGSFFAEEAVLFDRRRPGPHLPSLGFGPELLWQGALQLRPFVAWGWRSDEPGLQRRPRPQFGISFLDPL